MDNNIDLRLDFNYRGYKYCFQCLLEVVAEVIENKDHPLHPDSAIEPTTSSPPSPPSEEDGDRSGSRKGSPDIPIREHPAEHHVAPLPRTILNKIEKLGGFDPDHCPRLIYQKKLYKSDINKGQYRLSMPVKQCDNEIEFKTEEKAQVTKMVEKKFVGLDVDVIQPVNDHEVMQLSLKEYDVQGVHSFVFGGKSWNDFVDDNGLKVGDYIQVWQFRLKPKSKLCFAIVKLDP